MSTTQKKSTRKKTTQKKATLSSKAPADLLLAYRIKRNSSLNKNPRRLFRPIQIKSLGKEYRPKEYFMELRMFNFYNPRIAKMVLRREVDFKDNGGGCLKIDVNDTNVNNGLVYMKLFSSNNLYYQSLENIIRSLSYISVKQEPEIYKASCLGTISALFDLWECIGEDLYNDFLLLRGIFANCSFFKVLTWKPGSFPGVKALNYLFARKELIDLDKQEGYDCPAVEEMKVLSKESPRSKDIFLSLFKDVLKVDTEEIPGLGFPNPWREAVENKFAPRSLEIARECLRNTSFMDEVLKCKGKKEISQQWNFRNYRTPMGMNELIEEFSAAATTIREFIHSNYNIQNKLIICISRGLFRYKTTAKSELKKRLHKKIIRK